MYRPGYVSLQGKEGENFNFVHRSDERLKGRSSCVVCVRERECGGCEQGGVVGVLYNLPVKLRAVAFYKDSNSTMCAGKLFALIKKCLSRSHQQQQQDNHNHHHHHHHSSSRCSCGSKAALSSSVTTGGYNSVVHSAGLEASCAPCGRPSPGSPPCVCRCHGSPPSRGGKPRGGIVGQHVCGACGKKVARRRPRCR